MKFGLMITALLSSTPTLIMTLKNMKKYGNGASSQSVKVGSQGVAFRYLKIVVHLQFFKNFRLSIDEKNDKLLKNYFII